MEINHVVCPFCNNTVNVIFPNNIKTMDQSLIPKEELDLFKQLKDLKVIFDVGARTDIDYVELWPEAEHHLFEPNPEFFKELEIKVKDKLNVFANNFGLGDTIGTKGYCSPLQAFLGSGGASEEAKADLFLPITTLARYLTDKNVDRVDYLKIDTEGHDLKVILGGYYWRNKIKYIQYEHWGEPNNKMIKGLLHDEFDIEDVGYRNMFCMNRNLVSEEERNRLKSYIRDNKLGELV